MADAVTTTAILKGTDIQVYRFTNISDGTGESGVAKITKASLVVGMQPQTAAPSKIALMEYWWSISGFANVRLLWDQTAQEVAAVLAPGNGARLLDVQPAPSGLLLPATAIGGGTGNLLLTTNGAINNATYDIMVKIKLIP